MTADDALITADDAAAAAALDANFTELIRWYASRPGGEIVAADDVTACSTGLAFRSVNCAVAIDLDPANADERIAEIGGWFERAVCHGAGWSARPAGRSISASDSSARASSRSAAAASGWRSTSAASRPSRHRPGSRS